VKKSLTLFLILVFVLSMAGIPAQAKKAGEIKDGVYTDNDYGFSFTIPNGWSDNVKKSKYALRLSMEQTSAVPPRHFQGDLRDYMQIPDIKVIVDTTSLNPDEFIDMLLNPDFKSKQKKGLMKYFKIIDKPHDILKRSQLTFAGAPAVMVEARQAYSMEVSKRGSGASDRGSDLAEVVNDYKSGAIFCTVRDGRVYAFHLICEYQTGGPLMKLFNEMINSIKFEEKEEAKTEEKSG
jgi:hypothetical protein